MRERERERGQEFNWKDVSVHQQGAERDHGPEGQGTAEGAWNRELGSGFWDPFGVENVNP